MKLFYVYKKEWSHYTEQEGRVVLAKDWKMAKGIAMADVLWADQTRDNIGVKELNISEVGIICDTDGIYKSFSN